MLRFLGQRLLALVVIALAIAYFLFLAMHLVGQAREPDAAATTAGFITQSAQDTITFFRGVIQGNLEPVPTISGPRPVKEILWFAYGNSLGIIWRALLLATIIGVGLGVWAALTPQKIRGYFLLTLAVVGISAPSFLIAVLLQNGSLQFNNTLERRWISMGGFGWEFQYLVLPLLVLSAKPVAYIMRATFIALRRVMQEDFVRTARAKGLTSSWLFWGHIARNLAVPVLTTIGVSLRFALGVLPLVEFIFGWPGVGLRVLEAVQENSPILVVAIALSLGLTIQLISLGLDFSYRFIDPRLREQTA
ncbi:MAG: ABC transporter permease [Chloroflexi bacterium]|nr:ABC transporter permease [Chloroflexota bacterium]MBP8056914.1 ABC transporter permease [Chloroflexota bacterium]